MAAVSIAKVSGPERRNGANQLSRSYQLPARDNSPLVTEAL